MDKFGNYEIVEKLHETKYTEIFRIKIQGESSTKILKCLRGEFPDPSLISRLHLEYELINKIHSEYVIKSFGIEKDKNRFGIILEDIEGISLKDYYKEKHSLDEFYKISILMIRAITDVHSQNIIHKDINPSNFIFNARTGKLKIIDFGISTNYNREDVSPENPNILEGTIIYISPEQTGRMNRSVDYRSDFYSLGITLYELLTGKVPFDLKDPMELIHSHIAKQATPPIALNPSFSKPLSDLIMKLISKTAESRYQSCHGILFDIESIQSGLSDYNENFQSLGSRDVSEKFQIPQKLYGREDEIKTLLNAFEMVNQAGENNRSLLMLISGYSGIGKSTLVAELYKPITERRGYFISGKFDQYQSSVPYSAIVFAFRGLIRQLLTENETNLQSWRDKFLESFDSKGQVIIDVIPEVELIIGPQPPVPDLPPSESKTRFNLVFQNFIRLLCSKNHPLVIFLDDLQWSDIGTLKLIELIMTDIDLKHLFLIGSYRDNEVNATHPLIMMLDELRKLSVPIQELKLKQLLPKHIEQIIADTLHSPVSSIKPLANLVETKTGGNPFFVNEFLKTLYSENLIQFNYFNLNRSISPWIWNIEQIKAKELTGNVVNLLVGNLKKLSNEAQSLLKLAACIGNQFDIRTISIISETEEMEIFDILLEPMQIGLISTPSKNTKEIGLKTCHFSHDRIQQAAYSLIEDSLKQEVHLKIGRLLLKNTNESEIFDKVFEIVNQLNSGIELISDSKEKVSLANLNLIAGIKAKNSNANNTALTHFKIGLSILPEKSWTENYILCFKLHKETALVEYTMGNFSRGKYLFATALENAISNLDKVEIFSIEMNLYMTQGEFKTGISSGLKALSYLGLNLPENLEALTLLVKQEEKEVHSELKGKDISSFFHISDQTDKEKIAIMQLLVDLWALAYLDANYTLLNYTVLKILNLSLRKGNTSLSAFGYVVYGMIIAGEGKYKEADELGLLAIRLNEKFNNTSLTGKINNLFCHSINPYNRHIRTNLPYYQASYQTSILCGDLTYAGWALFFIIWTKIEIGENLKSVLELADEYLPLVEKNNDFNITYIFKILQRQIQNLLGMTTHLDSFSDEGLKEEDCIKLWTSNNFDHGINWFSYSKGQMLYLYDRENSAYEILKSVEDKLPSNIGFFPVTKHNFYFSLSITAIYHTKGSEEKKILLNELDFYMAQMKKWADSGPENFLHKLKIIEAEKERIMENYLSAQKLYDTAIDLASKNGYIQEEAIASELCGKMWLDLEKNDFALLYFQKAHYAYNSWGAVRKVELLERKYNFHTNENKESDFFREGTILSRTTTEKTTRLEANRTLDIFSILKASQILSGEIVLDKLLTSLMKILIENAGAEKGFLLLSHRDKFIIETSWDSSSKEFNSFKSFVQDDEDLLSTSIINYIGRTKQNLVLDDVSKNGNFIDSYIVKNKPKSILGIPILNQGKLIGIIYLENNLTTGAFTKDRIEILTILSSQAAISIENARLFSNLENLTKEKTKVTTEMEIAKDIQTSLLPSKPVIADFEIATFMHTAELVGGDYYDVIHTEGRDWFVIGDVSGHGVSAGLIMMMTQTAIRTILLSMDTSDPSVLLKKVNQVITENIHKMKLEKYMTLTLFLKEKNGEIFYSGMHQDLLLYKSAERRVEVKETEGSWLGYFNLHNEFQVDKLIMDSNDVLLLYTDGITEATNSNKEMFEINVLISLLQDYGHLPVDKIKSEILKTLQSYSSDDDITFMVLKRK